MARSTIVTLTSDVAGVKIDASEKVEGKTIRAGQAAEIVYTQGREQWKLDAAQSDAISAFFRSTGTKVTKRGALTKAEKAAAEAAAAAEAEAQEAPASSQEDAGDEASTEAS